MSENNNAPENKAPETESSSSENIKNEIKSWIFTLVCAFVLAVAINSFLVVNATVPTGSMENTIMPRDRIMALRLSYLTGSPQRGDIVVFKYPDNEKLLYVKRVIGLPGDTVEMINGRVYINGSEEPLEEEYLKEVPLGNYGPYNVPADHYFMMGDNRNNSLDSRFWSNTFLSKDKILGKVLFRYFPDPKWLDS